MALLDRLKDATRPTNSIEEIRSPGSPRPAPDLHGANLGPAVEVPVPAARKPAGDAKAPAYATEPEAIARAYYVENRGGERRYYDDYQRKALAIRADDAAISSRREDLNTIRAMLTMAESRGWSEVKVNGSAEFRREAWIEAQARGMAVQGHKPSDLDRQEADRRRAERGQDPARVAPPPGTNEVKQAAAAVAPAAAAPPQTKQEAAPEPVPQATKPALAYELSVRNLGVVAQPAAEPRQETPAATAPRPSQDVPIRAVELGQAVPPRQAAPVQVVEPAAVAPDHRKALREATAELSPDGKLVLAAMSEKIDREMNKLNAAAKLEVKAFAAVEIVKKERAEGPVVLSPELRKLATAPEPAREQKPTPQPEQPKPQREGPEPPRRSRIR